MSEDPELKKRSQNLLDKAVTAAAAADIHMHSLLRYDVNTVNAIVSIRTRTQHHGPGAGHAPRGERLDNRPTG